MLPAGPSLSAASRAPKPWLCTLQTSAPTAAAQTPIDTGGAGRFWGYRGLRPVLATRQVAPEVGIRAGRVLRRWYKAKGLTKRVRQPRVDQGTARVTYCTTTLRKRLFRANRGFLTVNDAPAMASQLARYLSD